MPVGVCTGVIHDDARADWDGIAPRPIAWIAWYPADEGVAETPMRGGGSGDPWFDIGPAARNAPLGRSARPFPVVLLSHGTGGTAFSLGWLGRRLAQRGFVALAVNHHGNTATEPNRAEGFICWWERAADFTALLDAVPSLDAFKGRLDLDRVVAVGFSLGAHTALSLLGATTDMGRYGAWAAGGPFSKGPSNFPDLADRLPDLMAQSAVFRASWDRQGLDHGDVRVTAALLLAPAPPVRAFPDASLASIAAPVHIITGGADEEAPAAIGAEWLMTRLPQATLDMVAPHGGHFIFLPESTEAGRRLAAVLCEDAPGIDRAAIHETVAAAVEALYRSGGENARPR